MEMMQRKACTASYTGGSHGLVDVHVCCVAKYLCPVQQLHVIFLQTRDAHQKREQNTVFGADACQKGFRFLALQGVRRHGNKSTTHSLNDTTKHKLQLKSTHCSRACTKERVTNHQALLARVGLKRCLSSFSSPLHRVAKIYTTE